MTEITYAPFSPEHFQEARDCLVESFIEGEPMANLLQLPVEAFRHFVGLVLCKALKEDLSMVALETENGRLVGCAICEDYASLPPDGFDQVDECMAPILGLLDKLNENFVRQYKPATGEYVHFFMRGVVKGFEGRGIGKELGRQVAELARKRGYKGLLNEATGPVSQYLTARSGAGLVNEIRYAEYEHDGRIPFSRISVVPTCKLFLLEL